MELIKDCVNQMEWDQSAKLITAGVSSLAEMVHCSVLNNAEDVGTKPSFLRGGIMAYSECTAGSVHSLYGCLPQLSKSWDPELWVSQHQPPPSTLPPHCPGSTSRLTARLLILSKCLITWGQAGEADKVLAWGCLWGATAPPATTSHYQPLPNTESSLGGLQPAGWLCLPPPTSLPPLAGTA